MGIEPSTMRDTERIAWLDLLRGLSALAVCAGHLRAAIFVSFADLDHATIPIALLYASTSFGHQAVMVFFVLSGYFVGGSVLRSGPTFNVARYASARLSRLWVVLIPALALTGFVDEVLKHAAPRVLAGDYYTVWNLGPAPGAYSDSAETLLGNLLFLQTLATPTYGVNTPLWSLANEFWYYVLFPLLAVALGLIDDRGLVARRTLAGAGSVALMFALPTAVLTGFIVWLFGAVSWWISTRIARERRYWAMVSALFLLVGALGYSKALGLQARLSIDSDILIGLSAAALCAVIATWSRPHLNAANTYRRRAMVALSEYSYSLYLVHFPVVLLIAALAHGGSRVLPNLRGLTEFVLWLLVLNVLGVGFWYSAERHTVRIRDAAARMFRTWKSRSTRLIEGVSRDSLHRD